MGVGRSNAKRSVAGDVWRLMTDFSMSSVQRGYAFGALKELGLTPGHLKVLSLLQPDEPLPMGVIAEALSCDPSMATWLVDRLEERDLVERKMLVSDRRVKTVTLTSRGEAVKVKVMERLYEPPDELLALDRASLMTLRRELAKLPRPARPFLPRPHADVEAGSAARRPG